MEKKVNLQWNKIFHWEDLMIMYVIYNWDTLEQLIQAVNKMHNIISWYKKIFAGNIHAWFAWYLSKDRVGHYVINSIYCPITIREKYVRMHEGFIEQLKMYAKALKILSKGYLPILLLPLSKLHDILCKVRKALQIKKKNYDLVLYIYIYIMIWN